MSFKDLVDESFDNGTKPFKKAITAVKTIAKGIDEKQLQKKSKRNKMKMFQNKKFIKFQKNLNFINKCVILFT